MTGPLTGPGWRRLSALWVEAFALCVQSILIAADAGYIEVGERVIATTADTAIIALAARTETFISPTEGLIVEHVITRPSVFDI